MHHQHRFLDTLWEKTTALNTSHNDKKALCMHNILGTDNVEQVDAFTRVIYNDKMVSMGAWEKVFVSFHPHSDGGCL